MFLFILCTPQFPDNYSGGKKNKKVIAGIVRARQLVGGAARQSCSQYA